MERQDLTMERQNLTIKRESSSGVELKEITKQKVKKSENVMSSLPENNSSGEKNHLVKDHSSVKKQYSGN